MLSYIILAAGASSRFHSPKALTQIDDILCINYLLNKIVDCPLNEIIIVLGAQHDLIESRIIKHKLIQIVYNNHHYLGQTSSVIEALTHCKRNSLGFAIHPVDCPFVKTATINTLLDTYKNEAIDILIPTYKSKKGHPALFNQKVKEQILSLNISTGINTIFKSNKNAARIIEVTDAGIIQSFNTKEELNSILKDRQNKLI